MNKINVLVINLIVKEIKQVLLLADLRYLTINKNNLEKKNKKEEYLL